MRLALTLVAASSALLALGTRQSLATPREAALTTAVTGALIPVAGIPRFPARSRPSLPPPSALARMDTLRLLARPLGPRECPMPVAGVHPGIDLRAAVEARRVPGSMPVASSACVNPLAR